MGIFRTRDRFNVKADGYWMKGRCVLPGILSRDTEYYGYFSDTGTIVKNRKGKRRPKKVKANVDLSYIFYGRIGGVIQEIGRSSASFRNKRTVRHKSFRIRFEYEITGGIKIVGMKVEIVGWRNDLSAAKRIECRVGKLP